MSDASTTRMIEMYMEDASAPRFLSGFFQSPPRNFHNTEKVELDVIRETEDVAIVVQDLRAGGRDNESTLAVNKGFTPPIFKERGAITAYDASKRQAGQNPFDDPDFGANATLQSFRLFRVLENKIRRAIELMAAQVFQTGVLTLTDDAGTALYTLDFKPKAANHATVSTTWAQDGSAGTPLEDVEGQCRVIRRNGGKSPKRLIFGSSAWQRWIANDKVRDNFRTDALAGAMGNLTPETRGEGANFMGWVRIGAYMMEMWLYEADYKDPQTGNLTPYVNTDKVIISGDGRLDLTYGGIPRIRPPEERALTFLPERMSGKDEGLDLTINSWFTPDGETLMVQAGTRPLTIPTAIDTVGTLDVTA